MKTMLEQVSNSSIEQAARFILNGQVVAIPTETVYGLAANALNYEAVERIFKVKNRPQDNPLIVHISSFDMLNGIVSGFNEKAKCLANAFWPGPLTIILPVGTKAAKNISMGLNSIAVRMPAHKAALRLIDACGVPLAAPSANLSGKPSPTTAQHVFDDLNGKIPLVLDGGPCEIGLESTVISLLDEPKILRPGKISEKDIQQVLGKSVFTDKSVFTPLKENEKPQSPGTKYKHYAPEAELILINSNLNEFISYINSNNIADNKTSFALCFDGEENKIPLKCVSYGRAGDTDSQAKELFGALRKLDKLGAKMVYARVENSKDNNTAVYNRMLRAAAFNEINI